MAITTLAQVNAALPGQTLLFLKSVATANANVWYSPWLQSGGLPAAGAIPSSGLAGDIPTDATAGAPLFVSPTSGNTYLARLAVQSSGLNTGYPTLAVYDRLWHNSGINVTITTPQTINSVALTRPSSAGDGAEVWLDNYVAVGSTTPVVTLAYTNSAGTGSRTATVVSTLVSGINTTRPFTLTAGDTGVRSIQTYTANATFTSGTIGLVLRRQLTMLPVTHGVLTVVDAIGLGLPRVYDDACLEILWMSNQGSGLTENAVLSLIQG
jgi:hypothetical protein